jgi:hypothetical protein
MQPVLPCLLIVLLAIFYAARSIENISSGSRASRPYGERYKINSSLSHWNITADFSSVQGYRNWHFGYYDGSNVFKEGTWGESVNGGAAGWYGSGNICKNSNGQLTSAVAGGCSLGCIDFDVDNGNTVGRWITPYSSKFSIYAQFKGYRSRGFYVLINGVDYSSSMETSCYSSNCNVDWAPYVRTLKYTTVTLSAGDVVDFVGPNNYASGNTQAVIFIDTLISSSFPTAQPTSQSTRQPILQPYGQPTSQPSSHPTIQPLRQPSSQPSSQITITPYQNSEDTASQRGEGKDDYLQIAAPQEGRSERVLDNAETRRKLQGAISAEFQINTITTGDNKSPTVAALSEGGFVATWFKVASPNIIYGRRYDSSAAAIGSEFQINTITTGSYWNPTVAALSGGGFVVTWHNSASSWKIYGRRYDSSATAMGSEFQINTNTGNNFSPAVAALSEGGFVVTWYNDASNDSIYGRRYDSSAAAMGSEFQINTITTGDNKSPTVAALSGGGFVVTWFNDASNDNIYGRRYDSSAAAIGSEFQINTLTTGDNYSPTVAALSGGGFVVTWENMPYNTPYWYKIYGRLYDSSATAMGSEFQINTITTGSNYFPTVAALSGGGFVVTWHNDAGNDKIYGRLYDSSAAAMGSEFQINTNTGNNQRSTVAALSGGDYVVTWHNTASPWIIYGRLLTANAFPTSQPSGQPTSQPSIPTSQPTSQPSIPTSQPTSQPSIPTSQPTSQPTKQPFNKPSSQPTRQPTSQPTKQPFAWPTRQPTRQPTDQPSTQPTSQPTRQPSVFPSSRPTLLPTAQPISYPSTQPSNQPSRQPSGQPSFKPIGQPTTQPSEQPTALPTDQPSVQPTNQPTKQPVAGPSSQPSRYPSNQPTSQPTQQPTSQPSRQPTFQPISHPTSQPTQQPVSRPTSQPTEQPTLQPSSKPSGRPTRQPTSQPVSHPTSQPTQQPTVQPTLRILWSLKSGLTAYYPFEGNANDKSGNGYNGIVHGGTSLATDRFGNPHFAWSFSAANFIEIPGEPFNFHANMSFSTWIKFTAGTQSWARLLDKCTYNYPDNSITGGWALEFSDQVNQVWFGFKSSSNIYTGSPGITLVNSQWNHVVFTKQGTSGNFYLNGLLKTSFTFQYSQIKANGNLPLVLGGGCNLYVPLQFASFYTGLMDDIFIFNRTLLPSEVLGLYDFDSPTSQPTLQPTCTPSGQPSGQPSAQPSMQPISPPTSQPTTQPSGKPTDQPTDLPSNQPSSRPNSRPTGQPTGQPTTQPFARPTDQPTRQPSNKPTKQPSSQPSERPTAQPTLQPSSQPSSQPNSKPSGQPTGQPTLQPISTPSAQPSTQPRSQPTDQPTGQPSSQPSSRPSGQPTGQPSSRPTPQPTDEPSSRPADQPSTQPTNQPSSRPTSQPTRQPSAQPSVLPTSQPTSRPSGQPTVQPSSQPISRPSTRPSRQPSDEPSGQPSFYPTTQPSGKPTSKPTVQPSKQPSGKPTNQPTGQPTSRPSCQPTMKPSTQPTFDPSMQPTDQPTTQPSRQPSSQPTTQPSAQSTVSPTNQPTAGPSSQPTTQPSRQPTSQPSTHPSIQPSSQPSGKPTSQPSSQPSDQPSTQPTIHPSSQPTGQPSSQPSRQPTIQPSMQPSSQPTSQPSSQPGCFPTAQPSMQPSSQPTSQPSPQPSCFPTAQPSMQPSSQPSCFPTVQPSGYPTMHPTGVPTNQPSNHPSSYSTGQPSVLPSAQPTHCPSSQPSGIPSQPTGMPTEQPTGQSIGFPSAKPTVQPSGFPSTQPTSLSTCQPTVSPTVQPSCYPTVRPSSTPSQQPTAFPTCQLTTVPSSSPSCQPTGNPSSSPSGSPTCQLTYQPSLSPIGQPSSIPSTQPTSVPSTFPTRQPTSLPTGSPFAFPSGRPASQPSIYPSAQPSRYPSSQPSNVPSSLSTVYPTNWPSFKPRSIPSSSPSIQPASLPSAKPSEQPSRQPSVSPSSFPTHQPTSRPSSQPTKQPLALPTSQPSKQPVDHPTSQPTKQPTSHPSSQPSRSPSSSFPSSIPTLMTESPTPLRNPSISAYPSQTRKPTRQPITPRPTVVPTVRPSFLPTPAPTQTISVFPSGNMNFKESLFFFGSYVPTAENIPSIYLTEKTIGSSYIIFGKKGGMPREIIIGTRNSQGLFSLITHEAGLVQDQAMSRTVLPLGDFNGDSYEDLLVCDPMNSICFVYFGHVNGLQNLDVTFAIKSTNNDLFGWSIAKLNDANKDNYDDIAITALSSNVIYVFFGSNWNHAEINIDQLDPSVGIKIIGSQYDQNTGLALSSAGDFNNDGYSDILFSAIQISPYQNIIYILYLSADRLKQNISIDNLTANKHYFKIIAPLFSFAGFSLSNLGDINQDGFDDIIIGSIPYSGRYLTQKSYVIYGRNLSSTVFLTELTEKDGFIIVGGGFMVGAPDDVNGDGIPDIMISSYQQWQGKGNSYIMVYPRNVTTPPTFLPTSQPSSTPLISPTSLPSFRAHDPTSTPTFQETTNEPVSEGTFPPFLQATEKPSLAPKTSKPSPVPSVKSSTRFPTIKTNQPSVSPTRKPTESPTTKPTKAPKTKVPSRSPTGRRITSHFTTSIPSMASTESLSNTFQDVIIDKEGVYSELSGKMNFIISGEGSFEITSNGGGKKLFTILPSKNTITITDFNKRFDQISLIHFPYLYSLNELVYRTKPLQIFLSTEQKLIVSTLDATDLTEDNFIFQKTEDSNGNKPNLNLNFSAIITLGILMGCIGLYGCVTKLNETDEDDINDSKELYQEKSPQVTVENIEGEDEDRDNSSGSEENDINGSKELYQEKSPQVTVENIEGEDEGRDNSSGSEEDDINQEKNPRVTAENIDDEGRDSSSDCEGENDDRESSSDCEGESDDRDRSSDSEEEDQHSDGDNSGIEERELSENDWSLFSSLISSDNYSVETTLEVNLESVLHVFNVVDPEEEKEQPFVESDDQQQTGDGSMDIEGNYRDNDGDDVESFNNSHGGKH